MKAKALISVFLVTSLTYSGEVRYSGSYIFLDQPRVAIEVMQPDNPLTPDVNEEKSFGPSFFNTFLLDTGANGILVGGGGDGAAIVEKLQVAAR